MSRVQVQILTKAEDIVNVELKKIKVAVFTVEECMQAYPCTGTVTFTSKDVIIINNEVGYSTIFVKQMFVK